MFVYLGKYSMSDCCWSGQVWCRCMASFSSLPTLYTTRWVFLLLILWLTFFFSLFGKELLNNHLLGLQKDTGDARAFSFLQILELLPFLSKPPSMLFVENVVGFEVCLVWLNSVISPDSKLISLIISSINFFPVFSFVTDFWYTCKTGGNIGKDWFYHTGVHSDPFTIWNPIFEASVLLSGSVLDSCHSLLGCILLILRNHLEIDIVFWIMIIITVILCKRD